MRKTTTLLYSMLAALPLGATGATGNSDKLPADLRPLVAKGESVLAFERADLNGDGLPDLVFIVEPVKRKDKDRASEEVPRTLKIAVRSANGSLRVVKQNDKVAFCEACGGTFGDPFEGLQASTRIFTVRNYGGSGWRWTVASTFNYSRRDATWQLVGVDTSSFHASEPGKTKDKRDRPPRHFGKIDIADFDPEHFEGVGAR
jgi:hypothetical protein